MKPKAIIFDIDGTLADCRHRLHHLPNYDKFFAEMDKDVPVAGTVALAKALCGSFYQVFFVSGRPSNHRLVTQQWLEDNLYQIDPTHLYMRRAGDHRPDHIIKDEIRQEIEKTYDIRLVIDDRPKVVDMWRRAGYTCLQNEYTEIPKYAPGKLVMLVGPSGAGKDSWARDYVEAYEAVISSDDIRSHLCGDFRDQSKNAQVFELFHALVKTHLEHGGNVVANATHIKRADRLATLACASANAEIEYVVIDRPLEDKIRDGGWRNEVYVKSLPLIEYHHQVFQNNLKDILAGDNDPRVAVKDLRQ